MERQISEAFILRHTNSVESVAAIYRRYAAWNKESEVSKEIRVLAEVEKIWILYDLDENGTLDFEEIREYLREMASG